VTTVMIESKDGIRGMTGVTSVLVMTDPSDSLKMLRETLCVAQIALGIEPDDIERVIIHRERVQRLIDEIDVQRPLGPDGKHGKLHTPTCGCVDR
jgi:hypothetical protein